jgi:transcriptional regulator with XRE-family HTH domain
MDIQTGKPDPLPMAKIGKSTGKKATRPRREPPPLFIGQWIRAMDCTPAEVAHGTGINEGYLSEIISGKKKNPSDAIRQLIADFIKVPLASFYQLPPSSTLIDQVAEYDPELVARMAERRRQQS